MNQNEKRYVLNAMLMTFLYLFICWTLYLLQIDIGPDLRPNGVRPRELIGLRGIILSPFLHANFDHIMNNSLSFVVLNTYFFYFYRQIAWRVFPWMFLGSGMLLWLWGGPGNHIGASGIIYSLTAFLFFSGLFRKDLRMMGVSALVLFSYGSFFWGIFPLQERVSWEGHLSGALVGLVLSFYFRQEGPQRKVYDWELEHEEEKALEEIDPELGTTTHSGNQTVITYDFLPSETGAKKAEEIVD